MNDGGSASSRPQELLEKYFEGTLSSEELDHLSEALKSDPELARQFAEGTRDELLLHQLHTPATDAKRWRATLRREAEKSLPLDLQTLKKPPTRRSTRRQVSEQHSPWWVPALLAAGVLIAALVFFVSGPSEADRAATRKAREARAQALMEVEVRRQSEQDRQERERAQARAEAGARRLEAEARLRELEEKRKALSQAKPELSDPAAEREKRERRLAELKREQERIEQELREAVELAKKAERPVPEKPPQEEKPSWPKDAPATPSRGTTLASFATVEEVSGEAWRVAKEGKSPLAAGAHIVSAEGLQTGGGGSRIVLRFLDKTRVDLGPDTMLAELKTDSGKRLVLTQGALRAVVAKQPRGTPMIVTTPHGEAKVVGTTLRIITDPDPKTGTRLEVEEGKVELKNLAGKTVSVESGHYAVAAVGVELAARQLPPRPRPAAYIWRGETAKAWGAILQTVSLTPNQPYTLSVWIQTSIPFPGGSIGVRTESGAILAQQPFGLSESYARTDLNFKSSSTSTALIFVGFANTTNADAYVHVDDWSLVAQGGDGTNLIQDPDYMGQNQARNSQLSGPWFTEGPLENGGVLAIGVDPNQGRTQKGSSGSERK